MNIRPFFSAHCLALAAMSVLTVPSCMDQEQRDSFGNVQSSVDATKVMIEELSSRLDSIEKKMSSPPSSPAPAVSSSQDKVDEAKQLAAANSAQALLKGKLGDTSVEVVPMVVPAVVKLTEKSGISRYLTVHLRKKISGDWEMVESVDELVKKGAASGETTLAQNEKDGKSNTKRTDNTGTTGTTSTIEKSVPPVGEVKKVPSEEDGTDVKKIDPVNTAKSAASQGAGTSMINGKWEVQPDGSKKFVSGDPATPRPGDQAREQIEKSQFVEKNGVKVLENAPPDQVKRPSLEDMTKGKWVERDGKKVFVRDESK